jgi:hypothetical protein
VKFFPKLLVSSGKPCAKNLQLAVEETSLSRDSSLEGSDQLFHNPSSSTRRCTKVVRNKRILMGKDIGVMRKLLNTILHACLRANLLLLLAVNWS